MSASTREKFLRPREYPRHWAFWTVVVLGVHILLIVSPMLGIVAALVVIAIAIARWYGSLA